MHADLDKRRMAREPAIDIFGIFVLERMESFLRSKGVTATASDTTNDEDLTRYTCYAGFPDANVQLYWSFDELDGTADVEFGMSFFEDGQDTVSSSIYVAYRVREDEWHLGFQNEPFVSASLRAAKLALLAFDFEEEGTRVINESQAWKTISALVRGYKVELEKYESSRR